MSDDSTSLRVRPRRALALLAAALVAAASTVLVAPNAIAAPSGEQRLFPREIRLPDGFQPEGIAIGPGPVAYFGSLRDGSIYRASLITGHGRVIGRGPGTPAVGLKTDARGRLFVSGGAAGDARVVDTRTGRVLASFSLATVEPAFVNDVALTRDAAWFTDSNNAVLYKLPLRHGRLPSADDVRRIPLTGDLVYGDGFNLNGITSTPDRRALLAVQSNTGKLFRIDPGSGHTREVDLGGALVSDGDGLLLDGNELYVIQSGMTMAATLLRIDARGTRGRVVERIADPRFELQSPTTAAVFGDRVYLTLARFATPPEPDTEYRAISIRRR
ncbi:MAG: superoxide dismutase [Streptosporangiales bacterium]|nr:superoxide dismutase [Streptosporangiales bacterium]